MEEPAQTLELLQPWRKGHKLFKGLLAEEGRAPDDLRRLPVSKAGSFSLPTSSLPPPGSVSSPPALLLPVPAPSVAAGGSLTAITIFFHWPHAEIKAAQASPRESLALRVLRSTQFSPECGKPSKTLESLTRFLARWSLPQDPASGCSCACSSSLRASLGFINR